MLPERWKVRFDQWLLTTQAAKLLFVSTILVVALIPVFYGFIDPTRMSLWMRILSTVFVMLATLALFLLWASMGRYWLHSDDSKAPARRLWFFILLFGFWYGCCVYYYFVYLPQIIRRRRRI